MRESYEYECGHQMGECSCFDCDYPECDRYKRDGADEIYCEFHHLLRQQQLGEPVSEKAIEAAFMGD